MRLDQMLRARFRGCLREPFSLAFIVLAVIISVAVAVLAQEKRETGLVVAVINEDGGDYAQRLIDRLHAYDSFTVRELSYDQAMQALRQDRLEAAVVIRPNFSERLAKGDFENTLELLTSPSAQAPATISEPIVSSVMVLWMEALAAVTTRDYLAEHGLNYTEADAQAQREDIARLWESGSTINVERIEADGGDAEETADGPIETCVRWYAVLGLFNLVVGASWVLDISKQTLRIRMRQMGVRQWQVVLINSLVPLLLSLAGYFVAGLACAGLTGVAPLKVLVYLPALLLYLFGLLGVTLLTAALLKNILSLMFIAPVLTFLNGVLSGLILTLPAWAYVLKWLSQALPGRWLSQALSNPLSALPGALICGLAWMSAGIVVSALRSKRCRKL